MKKLSMKMWKDNAKWKCQWLFHLKIAGKKEHQTSDEIARLFVVFGLLVSLCVSSNVIIVLGRR